MYLPRSLRDPHSRNMSPSVLDQRRPIHCPCCGQLATLSLAAAARRGWNDFEEDASGWHTSAVCPACAAGASGCYLPPVHRCSASRQHCSLTARAAEAAG